MLSNTDMLEGVGENKNMFLDEEKFGGELTLEDEEWNNVLNLEEEDDLDVVN